MNTLILIIIVYFIGYYIGKYKERKSWQALAKEVKHFNNLINLHK